VKEGSGDLSGPYGGGVLTVGVDLAAEAIRTAVAWVEWSPGRAELTRLTVGMADDEIVEALLRADKAGIDCPLGWPVPFVEFVTAHQAGHVEVPADTAGRAWRRNLALRLTDQKVYERTGLTPLSVSADRIAHAAMRCAGLLTLLAQEGRPVDRCGRGVVVEVYPAASLKQWGLAHRGYKRPRNVEDLERLVDELKAAAPWLDLGSHESDCRRHHDAIDAVIAALAARAAFQGLATAPDEQDLDTAATEGWIALPTAPLHDLIEDRR
jgi:predicted nuclease with RNAse H fold